MTTTTLATTADSLATVAPGADLGTGVAIPALPVELLAAFAGAVASDAGLAEAETKHASASTRLAYALAATAYVVSIGKAKTNATKVVDLVNSWKAANPNVAPIRGLPNVQRAAQQIANSARSANLTDLTDYESVHGYLVAALTFDDPKTGQGRLVTVRDILAVGADDAAHSLPKALAMVTDDDPDLLEAKREHVTFLAGGAKRANDKGRKGGKRPARPNDGTDTPPPAPDSTTQPTPIIGDKLARDTALMDSITSTIDSIALTVKALDAGSLTKLVATLCGDDPITSLDSIQWRVFRDAVLAVANDEDIAA